MTDWDIWEAQTKELLNIIDKQMDSLKEESSLKIAKLLEKKKALEISIEAYEEYKNKKD